ncbi:MAG: hypothetical protein U1E53_02990 [Dongiaceae bacterium]
MRRVAAEQPGELVPGRPVAEQARRAIPAARRRPLRLAAILRLEEGEVELGQREAAFRGLAEQLPRGGGVVRDAGAVEQRGGVVVLALQAAAGRRLLVVARRLAEVLRAGDAALVEEAEPGLGLGVARLGGVEQGAQRAHLVAALHLGEGGVDRRQAGIAGHRPGQPPGAVEGLVVAAVGGAAIPGQGGLRARLDAVAGLVGHADRAHRGEVPVAGGGEIELEGAGAVLRHALAGIEQQPEAEGAGGKAAVRRPRIPARSRPQVLRHALALLVDGADPVRRLRLGRGEPLEGGERRRGVAAPIVGEGLVETALVRRRGEAAEQHRQPDRRRHRYSPHARSRRSAAPPYSMAGRLSAVPRGNGGRACRAGPSSAIDGTGRPAPQQRMAA